MPNTTSPLGPTENNQAPVAGTQTNKGKLLPVLLGVVVVAFGLFMAYQKFGQSGKSEVQSDPVSVIGQEGANDSGQPQATGDNSAGITGGYSVEFANLSGGNIYIACGYMTDDWESEGWFEISPNSSKTFNLPANFQQPSIFLFGTDANDDILWNSEDVFLCVDPDKKFHLYNHKNCEFLEGFKEFSLTGKHTVIKINGVGL
jgi:uncharacterized membrane protein